MCNTLFCVSTPLILYLKKMFICIYIFVTLDRLVEQFPPWVLLNRGVQRLTSAQDKQRQTHEGTKK